MEGQEKWSFLVWDGREGLLGAAALEYPEPFALLGRYLKAVPQRQVEVLSEVIYAYTALEDLRVVLPPRMGWHLGWIALDSWSKRAWPSDKTFPEKWKVWAFPLMASTFILSKGDVARALIGAFFFRLEGWIDPNTPHKEGAKLEDLPERPEPPEPLLGESLHSYLKRAEKHYNAFKAWAEKYQMEVSPRWNTRERDLLFLAWREVEGLSEEEIAQRVEKRVRTGHPTARYLIEGQGSKPLDEDRAGSLPELIHKALVLTRKRLRIT